MTFQPVDKYPNFVEIERKIQDFWDKQQIFTKLRHKNAQGECWSFLDGPITANNPMGVHHAWGRTLKDIFQRFHAMHGHHLRYQNGFDCQGLWVEVEVEKEHGFKSKRDIIEYGMDKFVRDCKERVLTYAAKQTEQSIRLGYWMEWDDPGMLLHMRDKLHEGAAETTIDAPSGKKLTASPEQLIAQLGSPEHGGSYFTFSTENNFAIWNFLKQCHHEGFIYRGTDVMPWCPRCGTGLSQMEINEGRKITTHTSVYVRFPIIGRQREALLVWTTTPWTLSSNVAAAVNPEMVYLKVRHGDWIYYVGKENFDRKRVQDLEADGKKQSAKLPSLAQILKGHGEQAIIVEELPGESLLGLSYQGPFDDLEAQNTPGGLHPFSGKKEGRTGVQCHRVIAWKEVSGSEGTGIVHIAPGCGAEDYGLGKENDLVNIAPLNEDGIFIEGFGDLTGNSVPEAGEKILQKLKEKDLLAAREQYPHVYPHCWRCKTELVFRLVDGWYIRMDWRDRIQKVVPGIRWIPSDGEAREMDWLRNMGDWLISKKRFWGLALPIWECKCGWFDVIGGEAELKEKAVAGWDQLQGHSPHRPYIDQVKIKCESCGGTAHRVEDVGNPWLDAGIVPFSTLRYHIDKSYWKEWFPSELVVECFPGQFRNWFYALLAMSALLDGRAPFKTLLGHALVRDERGEEMHKSKGNAIYFDEAADVLGAEVMRYIYASQNPVANLSFPDLHHSDSGKQHPDVEVRRKLLTLWNCYSFFISYALADPWQPAASPVPLDKRDELDRWIISRLQGLIESANTHIRDFAVFKFMAQMEKFTDELSNWYLRRSRRRFWKSGMDKDKQAAYETLYEVLNTLIRLLAPMLPFLSEYIYQNLVRQAYRDVPESIHLTAYPVADAGKTDAALEHRINTVIRIKNAGLNTRNQSKIKTRQPLGRMIVKARDETERAVLMEAALVQQILEECNVKTLELIDDEAALVTTRVQLNFKTLGAKLGKGVQQAKKQLDAADAADIRAALEQNSAYPIQVDGEAFELQREDIIISYDAGENAAVFEMGGTFVILDTRLTPELKDEGVARDLNRQIQNLRKDMELELSDRIEIDYSCGEELHRVIGVFKAYLSDEALAVDIRRVDDTGGGQVFKVAGQSITVSIRRV